MPANLTPAYLAAERRYRDATTAAEKVAALEAMLAAVPRHKGTDHLRGDLRRRLARTRQEAQSQLATDPAAAGFAAKQSGIPQVVLLGYPGTDRAELFAALTGVHSTAAETGPGSPTAASLAHGGSFQLLDTSPVAAGGIDPWLADVVRRTDGAAIVVELGSDEALDQVEAIIDGLARKRVLLGEATGVEPPGYVSRRALILALHPEGEDADTRLEELRDLVGAGLEIVSVALPMGENLSALCERLSQLVAEL